MTNDDMPGSFRARLLTRAEAREIAGLDTCSSGGRDQPGVLCGVGGAPWAAHFTPADDPDDPDDTDEYAHVGTPVPGNPFDSFDAPGVADSPGPARDPAAGDLAYFSSLDAPRWVILLAAVGLAWAGAMMAAEAVRRIAGAFNP